MRCIQSPLAVPSGSGSFVGCRARLAISLKRIAQLKCDEILSIGRDNIAVMDMRVSRHHCILGRDGNSYYLIDTNSTNGTYRQVGTSEFRRLPRGKQFYLDPGSEIRLGATDGPAIRMPICMLTQVGTVCKGETADSQDHPIVHCPSKQSHECIGRSGAADYFPQASNRSAILTDLFNFDLTDCERVVIERVLQDINENRRIKMDYGPAGSVFLSGSAHYYYAHEKLRIPDELILVDCGCKQMSMAAYKLQVAEMQVISQPRIFDVPLHGRRVWNFHNGNLANQAPTSRLSSVIAR